MRKLKARLCAGGHRQIEGVDYFETYAPVVNWNTVHLLLIIAAQMELATRQVDATIVGMAPLGSQSTEDSTCWSNPVATCLLAFDAKYVIDFHVTKIQV